MKHQSRKCAVKVSKLTDDPNADQYVKLRWRVHSNVEVIDRKFNR